MRRQTAVMMYSSAQTAMVTCNAVSCRRRRPAATSPLIFVEYPNTEYLKFHSLCKSSLNPRYLYLVLTYILYPKFYDPSLRWTRSALSRITSSHWRLPPCGPLRITPQRSEPPRMEQARVMEENGATSSFFWLLPDFAGLLYYGSACNTTRYWRRTICWCSWQIKCSHFHVSEWI